MASSNKDKTGAFPVDTATFHGPPTHRLNTCTTPDVYDETAFDLLRNSYEKRLRELHEIFLRLSQDIEADELLRQMKEDEISAKFRKERINEMVNEAIQNEREMTITHLMETNSVLLAECRRLDDERGQIVKNVNDKHAQLAKKIDEVESLLENERATKEFLAGECDKLNKRLKNVTSQGEEFARMKEEQLQGQLTEIRGQMNDALRINEELSRKVTEYETLLRERGKEKQSLERERGELKTEVDAMKGQKRFL
jgi:chromosome segregation ATPase